MGSLKLFLGFLVFVNIHEQVVPAHNPPLSIAKRKPARYEPTIHAVHTAQAVLKFVGCSSFDRTSPRGNCTRKIIWVNGVSRTPLFQLLKCPPEVIQDSPIDVFNPTV